MSLKNKIAFAVVILAAICAVTVLTERKKQVTDAPATPTTTESTKSDTTTALTVKDNLSEQAKSHAGLATPKLSDDEKKSVCKPALEAIETMPLKTLIFDLKNGSLKLNGDCLFHSANNMQVLKDFPKVCEIVENRDPSEDCVKKLFLYKALRIHRGTVGEDLNTLPTEVLIQKLIGLTVDNALDTPAGLQWTKEVGAKLYERLPESAAANKAALLGYVASQSLSNDDRTQVEKILSEGRMKFPEDWEIFESDLVIKKRTDEKEFKKTVSSFYQSNPSSGIGQYFMGCLKWSNNEATAARDLFKSALATAPKDTRFNYTYQYSLTVNPPEKVCTVTVNFDPDKF